jgi:hypothetical protein
MDNLKKYLLENKTSFDTDLPEDAGWTRLANRMSHIYKEKKRGIRRLVFGGMAAGALFAVAGFALWRGGYIGPFSPIARHNSQANALGTVPQAEAVGDKFSPLIMKEMLNLKQTFFYGPDTSSFRVFSLQWKKLEANEKVIKKNLRSFGVNEPLLKQLANNYQLKIRLLQQFSIEINKVKDYLPPTDTLIKTPSLSLLNL